MRDRPVGKLRLNVLSDGARLIMARHLPRFISKYLKWNSKSALMTEWSISSVKDLMPGYALAEPFLKISLQSDWGELRWVAVASPRYLYQHTPPAVPEDLRLHDCIQLRTGQGVIYKWEFRKGEDYRVVDVRGQLCVSETALAIEMALAGVGIAYRLEDRVR